MRALFILLSCCVICACGKAKESKPEPEAPPPIKIMEDQRKQLEKAKQVEDAVQKAADAQRDVIEVQTGGQPAKKANK
ncbi:hypothetical protein ACO0LM_27480 [Undibacterium sp. Di26W]|uniref:hypothetical protein n=1 Tax=Undibacterium sp. Di26W TaxID=3413035 RepID=UPI003BF3C482